MKAPVATRKNRMSLLKREEVEKSVCVGGGGYGAGGAGPNFQNED